MLASSLTVSLPGWTGSGEDSGDTIHWGYEQQIWNEDGDVVIVLDGNGEAVLEQEIAGEDDGTSDDQDNGASDEPPEEPPLSDISVRVVDPEGEPIEGATVTGQGEPHEADIPLEFEGETGDSGYHHNTIYENEYRIEVDHPDYNPVTVELVHDGETEVDVKLDPVVEEPDTFELVVRVIDSDGNPVEGATVHGEGRPYEADIPLEFSGETNEDGVYETVVHENEYHIVVSHPDHGEAGVQYDHDRASEVAIEL